MLDFDLFSPFTNSICEWGIVECSFGSLWAMERKEKSKLKHEGNFDSISL